ncbi:hypothetical protein DFQ27_005831 [Actinomortierella ambigua]|uniref:Mediator of RNA polymerase II transcription subunit 31 n=1 Tax=Actinomortierella ambigua TaxID=1343610 RepID=A0A9P6UC97_9FUNG|nr:hypothetical protein DFQ27_005831 [Actinomortierella ambigua]
MDTDTGMTSDHPPVAATEDAVAANPFLDQPEDEQERLKRFQIELEFVQCLANPWYLHNLAQQRYFDDEAFLNYIDYLQYFRRPEYAKFIIYPHCLHFLTLLQSPSFREALLKQETSAFVHEKQYYHWQFLRNQDKVVRKEIGVDGVPVEIKMEDDSSAAEQAIQGQAHPTSASGNGQPASSTEIPAAVGAGGAAASAQILQPQAHANVLSNGVQ